MNLMCVCNLKASQTDPGPVAKPTGINLDDSRRKSQQSTKEENQCTLGLQHYRSMDNNILGFGLLTSELSPHPVIWRVSL